MRQMYVSTPKSAYITIFVINIVANLFLTYAFNYRYYAIPLCLIFVILHAYAYEKVFLRDEDRRSLEEFYKTKYGWVRLAAAGPLTYLIIFAFYLVLHNFRFDWFMPSISIVLYMLIDDRLKSYFKKSKLNTG